MAAIQQFEADVTGYEEPHVVRTDHDQREGTLVLSFQDRVDLGVVSSREWYALREEQLNAAQAAWVACQGLARDHRAWDKVNQAHWWANKYGMAAHTAEYTEAQVTHDAQGQDERVQEAERYIQTVIDQFLN